jgi:hypothetical protein
MSLALNIFALAPRPRNLSRGETVHGSDIRIEVIVSGPEDMTDEQAEEAALDAVEAEWIKNTGF